MREEAVSTYTYEAYLSLEQESEIKYEFHDGFIVAMAGGSPEHSQIATNFTWAVNNALRNNNKSCISYNSDLKIQIDATRRSYYPDASVVCDKPIRSDKDNNAITNPILIVEVLSESTAAFDRGNKFAHYRQIPSLREYILISQEEATVDTYYRTDNGTWEIQTIMGLDKKVLLKSISCEISMADIYRLVEGINPTIQ